MYIIDDKYPNGKKEIQEIEYCKEDGDYSGSIFVIFVKKDQLPNRTQYFHSGYNREYDLQLSSCCDCIIISEQEASILYILKKTNMISIEQVFLLNNYERLKLANKLDNITRTLKIPKIIKFISESSKDIGYKLTEGCTNAIFPFYLNVKRYYTNSENNSKNSNSESLYSYFKKRLSYEDEYNSLIIGNSIKLHLINQLLDFYRRTILIYYEYSKNHNDGDHAILGILLKLIGID